MLSNVVVVLLMLGLVGLWEYYNYKDRIEAKMTAVATQTAKSTPLGVARGDRASISEFISGVQYEPSVVAQIILTPDRELALESEGGLPLGVYMRGTGLFGDEPDVDAASFVRDLKAMIEQNEGEADGDFFTWRDDKLYIVNALYFEEALVGHVYLVADMKEFIVLLDANKIPVLLAFIFLLSVSYILAIYLQRMITAPIGRLTQTVQSITAYNRFDQSVEIDRYDEIGTLMISFNKMTKLVHEGQQELASQRDNLKVVVDERTQELRNALKDYQWAAQEAQAANAAKSEFLARTSHELRTPLNVIGLNAADILDDIESEQKIDINSVKENLSEILSYNEQLLQTIKDILDFSKIEQGRTELNIQDFDFGEVLGKVETAAAVLARKNGNRLEVVHLDRYETMTSDDEKVRGCMYNLVSNACKFTNNGVISLAVAEHQEGGKDFYRISISDTGIGMTKEQQIAVFEPFKQADSSIEREYGGTGLGLPIVKSWTELLGGRIELESELGKGSTFIMYLPIKVQQEEDDAPSEKDGAQQTGHRTDDRRSVLIIDDESGFHESIAGTLEDQGYQVISAMDGRAGVELARKHKPCAILLDVMMPGKDGWEVMNDLKADEELVNIPTVIVTRFGDRDMAMTLGADDMLIKPLNGDIVSRALERYAKSEQSTVQALVVDDDDGTRRIVERSLSRLGWKTMQASDGREALAIIEETIPSVILLDLMMPGLNGFDLMEALQSREEWSSIPVIVLTGKDLTGDELAFLGENAQRVLRKGTDGRTALLSAVQRAARSVE